VSELEVSGKAAFAGKASRLPPGERLPVEALLDGEPEEALRLLDRAEEVNLDLAFGLAIRLLSTYPSRSATAASFLGGLAERFPTSAAVQEARGVAMLAAARDPRLDCVVAWASPSDWFRLAGTWGWTLEEQVSDGLRFEWRPGQGSGSAAQFIEWFLRGPIDRGRPSLAEVRARVAASSPLYFADTLPPSDLHYGVEDVNVPVANGLALRDRLRELGRSAPDYRVTLHEGAGHDMPFPWAYDESREFLLRHLVDAPPD
jgi:hypothetical protein